MKHRISQVPSKQEEQAWFEMCEHTYGGDKFILISRKDWMHLMIRIPPKYKPKEYELTLQRAKWVVETLNKQLHTGYIPIRTGLGES